MAVGMRAGTTPIPRPHFGGQDRERHGWYVHCVKIAYEGSLQRVCKGIIGLYKDF